MAFNDPSAATPQDQSQPPQQSDDLFSKWSSWLDKPSNRAAMMQFGIQMLQPNPPGQTALGAFGAALGAGGEAAGRVQAQELERQKAADTSELKGAQAQLAASRAEHAGEAAGLKELLAQGKMEQYRMQQEYGGFDRTLKARQQWQKEYENHLTDPTKQGQPFPSFDEWLPGAGLHGGDRPGSQVPVKRSSADLFKDDRWKVKEAEIKAISNRDRRRAEIAKVAGQVVDGDAVWRRFGESPP